MIDNISLSLNKSKIKNKNIILNKNKLIKKDFVDRQNTTCSINTKNKNNRKLNLCSLPNLLCNNYIFKLNLNDKNENKKKYKNRNSFQNLLEHKKLDKNLNKIINNKKLKKLFKNFKTINRTCKDIKLIKNSESEEKINSNKGGGTEDIKIKLNKIEYGVKSLLDGFYTIYLKSKQNDKNN